MLPLFLFPTLAQQNPLLRAEPPPLVSTSQSSDLLSSILFESPGAWFVVFACLVAAIALLTRPQKKLKYGGLALLFFALVVGLAQRFITTDREAIINSSRAAAVAVARADTAALQQLLSSDFKVIYFQAPQGLNKEQTIRRASELFSANPPEITISEIRALADNDRFGRSQIHLTGRGELTFGYPASSWWVLNWEKTPGGWQLSSAELLTRSIAGESP